MNDITNAKPNFEKDVFIAPGAQIVGNVTLLEGANIWYNAVLRGDEAPITVGQASNVQDNCTLHCDCDIPLLIGKNVTVGHNAILHSCTIGDGSLIGMGAIVLNNVTIGKGCLIAAGAVVTPRTVVPDGSLIMGSPAKVKRILSESEQQDLLNNAMEYTKLAAEYKEKAAREISENCILSKGLSQNRLNTIKDLVELCCNHENLNLKLNWSLLENRDPGCVNDILYYENGAPVGYLGLYAVSKTPCIYELTGMVLPGFRGRGIFSAMFGKAVEVCRSRGANKLILVTDSSLATGAEFAKDKGFSFERRELAMKCKTEDWEPSSGVSLTFRKASYRDVKELAFLDMMCFEIKNEEAAGFYSDGLRGEVFIAQEDGKPVGKVGITSEAGSGNIYGLAVVPGCRRRGLGREILEFALDRIFENSQSEAILEINENNIKALSLFTSSGFKTVAKHDYYQINL